MSNARPLVKVFSGIAVIAIAAAIAVLLVVTRKKPEGKERVDFAPRLNVMKAHKASIPVKVTAYGTVRPVVVAEISSQVKGIIEESRNLKPGDIVEKDELIVRIDPRDYEIQVSMAEAEIMRIESDIKEMRQKLADDTERLVAMEREAKLSEDNFKRMKNLFDQKAVSLSELDKAEQAFMTSKNAFISLRGATLQYPMRIDSLNALLAAANAKLRQADLDKSRCSIFAPFRGRVKRADVELGQNVTPGMELITLSDDSMIEIPVPVDTRDAALLGLMDGQVKEKIYDNWFDAPELDAEIRSVDADNNFPSSRGKAVRIENYDEGTRTVTIVLRIVADDESKIQQSFLADGMFCRIELSGKSLENVVEIPRTAFQFKGRVAVVDKESKVYEKDVTTVFKGRYSCIVSEGIEDGDLVVVSRLPFGIVDGYKVLPVIKDETAKTSAASQ